MPTLSSRPRPAIRQRRDLLRAMTGAALLSAILPGAGRARAEDNSPPAILQWFESSYGTIEHRTADVFMAGYGAVWTPPPGRADTGNFSVGYDVYDRFDLGTHRQPDALRHRDGHQDARQLRPPRRPRLPRRLRPEPQRLLRHRRRRLAAGVQERRRVPRVLHRVLRRRRRRLQLRLRATATCRAASPGLIDIAHDKNYRADPQPRPRLRQQHRPRHHALRRPPRQRRRRETTAASTPTATGTPICVFDPITGEQNIPVYSFNTANPMAGDPVEENALGLPHAQRAVARADGRRRRAPHRRGQARRRVRARLPRPRRLPPEPAQAARRQHEPRLQLQRGVRRQRAGSCCRTSRRTSTPPTPAASAATATRSTSSSTSPSRPTSSTPARPTPGRTSRTPASTSPTTACTTARPA